MENTPLLETERLILRKFEQGDIGDILLIYADRETNRFVPRFPIASLKEAEALFYDELLPEYAKDAAYRYAIALKENNRPIGYVGVGDLGRSNDLGYGLREEYWRRGIATEACRAVVHRLREDSLPFITATHDVHNPRSGEVMKKIGMKYRYSYEELWQPKNFLVTFRMYQLNFDDVKDRIYKEYWNKYENHFVEDIK